MQQKLQYWKHWRSYLLLPSPLLFYFYSFINMFLFQLKFKLDYLPTPSTCQVQVQMSFQLAAWVNAESAWYFRRVFKIPGWKCTSSTILSDRYDQAYVMLVRIGNRKHRQTGLVGNYQEDHWLSSALRFDGAKNSLSTTFLGLQMIQIFRCHHVMIIKHALSFAERPLKSQSMPLSYWLDYSDILDQTIPNGIYLHQGEPSMMSIPLSLE